MFERGPQPGPVAGSNGAVTGWTGFINVDGTTYTWMGAANVNGVIPPSVTQTSFEYTSSRSTFIMNVAGKVSMNVTFLSPVTPNDIRRQSIIGSYLSVKVAATDGGTHSVRLYADTTAGTPTPSPFPVFSALEQSSNKWIRMDIYSQQRYRSMEVCGPAPGLEHHNL